MMNGSVRAVILAGGRSLRMGGGDKCLLPLGGSTILVHVVAALQPQVGESLINGNSDPRLFFETDLEVRADTVPGRLGPLAGIRTAMEWARERGAPFVLTVPADTPFLPPHDLVARLLAARVDGRTVIAASGGDTHPTVGLWPTALAERLHCDLVGGIRRVRAWLDQVSFVVADV